MNGTLQKQWDNRMKIRKGEPVEQLGLTFYPITVSHYEEFMYLSEVLTIRQSSLPVRYISYDFLSALFHIEMDALKDGGNDLKGSFYKFLLAVGLSLRIDIDGEEIANNIFYKESRDGKSIEIDHIIFKQDGNEVSLKPLELSTVIRPLIAEQNGLKLPDESENIDLVKANDMRLQMQDNIDNLEMDIESSIDSVAYLSGVSSEEVWDWTIRKFTRRRKAIDRDKRYTACKSAEMGGMVKFEKGNPCPSWEFDLVDNSLGTVEYSKNKIQGVVEQH